MNIKILRDNENHKWDDYVNKHPGGHIFHLTKWKKILQDSFGYFPLYLYCQNQKGEITGILPLMKVKSIFTGTRVISLPFSFICGPIADSVDISISLLSEVRESLQEKNHSYIEIKLDHEISPAETHYRSLDNLYYHYTLSINSNADDLFRSFHKNMVQRAVLKAEREGVEIVKDSSDEALRAFYHLNCLTHRKHGLPPQPFSYFQNMFDVFKTENRLILLLAKINQVNIAAGIFVTHGTRIYYLYGASDERHLRLRANQLLMWNLIKWGIENNYALIDMGRVSIDNKGLRDYKKRWNSSENPLYYYYFPEIKGVGSINRKQRKVRFLTSVWRHIPVSLIKKTAFLYKHLA